MVRHQSDADDRLLQLVDLDRLPVEDQGQLRHPRLLAISRALQGVNHRQRVHELLKGGALHCQATRA